MRDPMQLLCTGSGPFLTREHRDQRRNHTQQLRV
jgi:hypothetical protein